MDYEKIIDKMRELREIREAELVEEKNARVSNVRYLGTVEYRGEPKEMFLLEEKREYADGSITTKSERYYTEDGILVGEKKNVERTENFGKLNLNKLEEERLESIALALGTDKEHIRQMSEIDVKQKIEDKKDKMQEPENKKEPQNENQNTISKKQMEKVSAKTEIAINQKVTDNETIAELLKVTGKGYKKIAIVNSDSFKDSGNTTRFSIVGIKEDGTAEKIDSLEQGYGQTPTKPIVSSNGNGSKIKEKQVNSIFKIKGESEKQISVRIGAMGSIEIDFVRTPVQDNSKAMSIPIETTSIRPTTREMREFMNKSRNSSVNGELKKYEEHKKEGCDETEKHNIDDREDNDTHLHLNKNEVKEIASEIYKNPKIANIYNSKEIEGYVKMQAETAKTKKELKEKVEEKLEKEAEREHVPWENRNR